MKHVRFEYNPDGRFVVSCIATKKVKLKEGDAIKVHGVSEKVDDVYIVGVQYDPILAACLWCPFRYEYKDTDGLFDYGCRAYKKMDGVGVPLCKIDDGDRYYTFTKLSDTMERV